MTGPGRDAEKYLHVRWKAVPNDLIGGWCAVPDAEGTPTSPAEGAIILLDGAEELVRYAVGLHNYRLNPTG